MKGKGKRRNLIKIIAIAVAVCLVAGAITSYFVFFRKTKITVAARSDVISYFDENGVTEYLEKAAKVKISWQDYGSEDVYTRVQQDIGKKQSELPDVYLGLGLYEEQVRVLSRDLFMDITNLVDSVSKEYKNVIAEDTSRQAEMQIDGKIYSYPYLQENYAASYPQKVWINSEWLTSIGADIPKTTEEFYNVLVKFKNSDPNGNAKKDEVPLGVAYKGANFSTLGFLVNAFVTSEYDLSENQGYINVNDAGEVYTAVTDPKFKEALQYIQKLFQQGLINQDAFTKDADMFLQGSKGNETYGVIAAQDLNVLFNDPTRAASYVPLPPLDGGNQATLVRRTQAKATGFMLSKETEQYKAALALGDAMLSMEGTLTICYGPEGTGWNYADNTVASMGGTETKWALLPDATEGADLIGSIPGGLPLWNSAAVQMSRQAMADDNGKVNLQTADNWQGYLNQVTREVYEPVGKQNLKNTLPEIVLSDEQEAALNQKSNVRADIFAYLSSTCKGFVTGKTDINGAWDNYVKTLKDKGLETLLQMMQEAYDRQS